MTATAYPSQASGSDAVLHAERRGLIEDLGLEEAFVADALDRLTNLFRRNEYAEGIRVLGEVRDANARILHLRAEVEQAA